MKIETLIERMNGRMTPADRKIVEVLLTLGSEAAFLSAHELSRRAGTHAATAVRFARKLGYAGYPEFQAELRGAALAAQGPADRMRSRLGQIGPGDTLKLVIEGEMSSLVALAEQVAPDRLDALTERLMGARKIA
ncbi:MAG: MurR/RpiR family transcriptional regulator, partial [Paracoccaceae bacterium]